MTFFNHFAAKRDCLGMMCYEVCHMANSHTSAHVFFRHAKLIDGETAMELTGEDRSDVCAVITRADCTRALWDRVMDSVPVIKGGW